MSTLKQIEANHRNGAQSHGPKTEEGKAASSKNALKHGLLSHDVLLPNENIEEFEQFGQDWREGLNPVGALESSLVERIIEIAWRIRRLGKIETGILTWHYYQTHIDRYRYAGDEEFDDVLARARGSSGESALLKQREHLSAQKSDVATFGEAFIRDSRKENALTKLSRYETSMTRNLLRMLHELERLQAARHGKEVPVPVVADVDVTGIEAL